MSAAFDPYYKWLGIRPDEQPPNYYRLLGIAPFEPDAEVISNAADQRMGHVRVFQAGPHSAISQTLLNEIARARVSLLNPQRKAQYDALLQQRLKARSSPPPPQVQACVVTPPMPCEDWQGALDTKHAFRGHDGHDASSPKRKRQRSLFPVGIAVVALIGIPACVLLLTRCDRMNSARSELDKRPVTRPNVARPPAGAAISGTYAKPPKAKDEMVREAIISTKDAGTSSPVEVSKTEAAARKPSPPKNEERSEPPSAPAPLPKLPAPSVDAQKTPVADSRDDTVERLVRQLDAALIEGDSENAKNLLATIEPRLPNDPRLVDFRHKIEALTPSLPKPDAANSGTDVKNRKASIAKLPPKLIPETIDSELRLPQKGGPYRLSGSVTIAKTGALLIERGATVLVAPGARLTAVGTLNSFGESDDFVRFRPEVPLGAWDKISLESGASHLIERFDVRGATCGLGAEQLSRLQVKNCVFSQNKIGIGIGFGRSRDYELKNCAVISNYTDGVQMQGNHVAMDHCTISGNGEVGVNLVYYGELSATSCNIVENNIGIQSKLYETHVDVTSSNIVGNRTAAIHVRTDQDFQCRGNFWGTKYPQQIAMLIIDGRREPGHGVVVFTDFLAKPIADAGCSLRMPKEKATYRKRP
jgi:hypothetical protein